MAGIVVARLDVGSETYIRVLGCRPRGGAAAFEAGDIECAEEGPDCC